MIEKESLSDLGHLQRAWIEHDDHLNQLYNIRLGEFWLGLLKSTKNKDGLKIRTMNSVQYVRATSGVDKRESGEMLGKGSGSNGCHGLDGLNGQNAGNLKIQIRRGARSYVEMKDEGGTWGSGTEHVVAVEHGVAKGLEPKYTVVFSYACSTSNAKPKRFSAYKNNNVHTREYDQYNVQLPDRQALSADELAILNLEKILPEKETHCRESLLLAVPPNEWSRIIELNLSGGRATTGQLGGFGDSAPPDKGDDVHGRSGEEIILGEKTASDWNPCALKAFPSQEER